MRTIFRFYKTEDNKWYIDLPDWSGALEDVEMNEGADVILDKVSRYASVCHLEISTYPIEGCDELKLVTDLRSSTGGGEYIMESYKGESVNHKMRFCEVAETVFGKLPKLIYVNYLDLVK